MPFVLGLAGIVVTCAAMLFGQSVAAVDSPMTKSAIVVLDFELHDLTVTPELAEELERTASIAPLLRAVLETQYGFEIVPVDSDTQTEADKGSGYLFEHHDVAAELGRQAGSDWVVVGRVHKASFLFVYFKARIIDTKTERLVKELVVEVKGTQKRLTEKGVESLAEQVAAAIQDT